MNQPDPLDKRIFEADWKAKNQTLSEMQQERWRREALGLRLTKAMRLNTFRVDLDRRPVEIDITPPPALARFFRALAIFFLIMTAFPLILVVQMNEPGTPWWAYALMGLGPTLCVIAIITCSKKIGRERRVLFDAQGVQVHQKGLGRVREWNAPYSAFDGIAHAVEVLDTRYAKIIYHMLLLTYPEAGKNVPVWIGDEGAPPQGMIEYYCKGLGLAFLGENLPGGAS